MGPRRVAWGKDRGVWGPWGRAGSGGFSLPRLVLSSAPVLGGMGKGVNNRAVVKTAEEGPLQASQG